MTPFASNEPLLDFRLAYLRAVARSWSDIPFRGRLLEAQDIQPILNEEFGFQSRWLHLNVKLDHSPEKSQQTQWRPELTERWIGRDDVFVIALPEAPSIANAAEGLAAYYQMFPAMMGPAVAFEGSSPRAGQILPAGTPDNGAEQLLAFGSVVLRAIALSWKSDQFRRDLIDQQDATAVLSQYLGYNNPFNFQLRFVPNRAFTWSPQTGAWNMTDANGKAIKNEIVLNYPVAPADETMWPIALTSYNNTGNAYPFTC
jgi:ribosomally synthesized peptide (two-chain TOMM family)